MFAGYLFYGLWCAGSIYGTVYYVACQLGQGLPDGTAIGLWVAGDNAFGLCVIAANLVLLHRLQLFDRLGMLFYALSIGSYYLALALQSSNAILWFPKVFGTFSKAWLTPLVWISLGSVVIQVCATERAWEAWVNRDAIFNDGLRKEYQAESEAHARGEAAKSQKAQVRRSDTIAKVKSGLSNDGINRQSN